MQVSSLSQNNISHKGFKTDYQALRRQYSKAQFIFSICKNNKNYDKMLEAQTNYNLFCHSNPIRSYLQRQLENLKVNITRKNFKSFRTSSISMLEKDLLMARENMDVEVNGKKLSIRDFDKLYISQEDPIKKEEMRLALIKAQEPLQNLLEKLVVERNEFAQNKGYKNYYELILKERFDIKADEVDGIIQEFSSRKDIASGVAERKNLLAQYWGIKPDEVKPYHFAPLTMLYNYDSYIESPEQIAEMVKSTYEAMGFDIKSWEKQNRIFYDLFKKDGKSIFSSYCRLIPEADAVGMCLNTTADNGSIRILLHEFGHLVYDFSVSKLLSYKNKRPKAVYTEAIAMMFEKLIYKEDLLKGIIPKEEFKMFKRVQEIDNDVINTYTCVNAEFEKEIYENPHQDYSSLKSRLNEKYKLNSGAPLWYYDLLVPQPARSIVYVKALLLADKMYDTFTRALGSGFIDNPQTAEFLKDNFLKYGKLMNDKKLNRKLDSLA